jgi:hypothetical protein
VTPADTTSDTGSDASHDTIHDTVFDTGSILPDDSVGDVGGLDVLHDREYRVRAFRLAADRLLIRGAVRDQKPPDLYIADDDQPLTIHHMQIDLEVGFPSLEIVAATVRFETHPHGGCPSIIEHYGGLVGLSIARGFTHKVRELFGGPRGCTHTTALLQAMAPVAVQCFWSMEAATSPTEPETDDAEVMRERRRARWSTNLNTCHVWAEDGELVENIEAGGEFGTPIFIAKRVAELGLEADDPRLRLHR